MGGVTPPVRVEEYKARSAPLMPDSKLHRFTFTVRVTDSTGAHADEPGSIIVH
jgi:hypothetical protein